MRKIALIVLCWLSILPALIAQERTKIVDGVYLIRHGNIAVIEDDINQITWNLSVTVEESTDENGNKLGEYVYHFACANKYTYGFIYFSLIGAIFVSLSSAPMCVGTITADVAATMALVYYDDVCDYYKEKMQD